MEDGEEGARRKEIVNGEAGVPLAACILGKDCRYAGESGQYLGVRERGREGLGSGGVKEKRTISHSLSPAIAGESIPALLNRSSSSPTPAAPSPVIVPSAPFLPSSATPRIPKASHMACPVSLVIGTGGSRTATYPTSSRSFSLSWSTVMAVGTGEESRAERVRVAVYTPGGGDDPVVRREE